MSRTLLRVVWMACVSVVPPAGLAADWPGWGGPDGNGHSSEINLLKTWPPGGPRVLWHQPLGQGYSSFAVVEGKAYTLSQDLWGQSLVCLEGATGKTAWSRRFDAPYEPAGIYPGPRSTPTVADGRVYFVSPDAVVYCADASTGETLWTVPTAQRFHGSGTDFGYSASVRVIDGRVILPVGGRDAAVVALDAKTGNTVWTAGDEPASYCPVQPMTLGDVRCILAYLQNGLLLCRLDDGKVLWKEELSSGYDEHSVIPVIRGDQFMISAPFKSGASAHQLYWTTADPPTIASRTVWQTSKLSNDTASSILVDDAIFGFDMRDPQSKAHRPSRGEFRCLDWNTGEVQWSDATIGHATVLAADGKLILFNDRGELILAHADASACREIGRAAVFRDEVCWTAPALSNGLLYLRTQSHAACIDLRESTTVAADSPSSARPAGVPLESLPQTIGWNWFWLLNGEREHPFMRPTRDELVWWYLWSCLTAVLPAIVAGWLVQRFRPKAAAAVVCGVLFVAGAIASPLLNWSLEDFVFTWPAALFGGLLAMLCLFHALHGKRLSWTQHLLARLALLSFAGMCIGYYLLLRHFSLPHEWVFLIGFLPACWPAYVVASRLVRSGATLLNGLAVWLTFSWYFWCCGGWELFETWRAGA